jgi:hypothetical protein
MSNIINCLWKKELLSLYNITSFVIKARILAIYLSLVPIHWVYLRLKWGGVHTCHSIDSWWLHVIRAVLISGCVRNMQQQLISIVSYILHLQFGWDGYSLIKQMGNSPNKWLKLLQYLKSNYIRLLFQLTSWINSIHLFKSV